MVSAAHHLGSSVRQDSSWTASPCAPRTASSTRFSLRACHTGAWSPSARGFPRGRERFQDFIGINYYSREMVYPISGSRSRCSGTSDFASGGAGERPGVGALSRGVIPVLQGRPAIDASAIPSTSRRTARSGRGGPVPRSRYSTISARSTASSRRASTCSRYYHHWTLMDNFRWAEYRPKSTGRGQLQEPETDHSQERHLLPGDPATDDQGDDQKVPQSLDRAVNTLS